MSASHLQSGGRYPVLRTLGILYLAGAGLATVGGIGGAMWALFEAPNDASERGVYALIALAATFFVVLSMLAIAEFVKLMIDIEHNTRAMSQRTMPSADARTTENNGGGSRIQWLDGEETAEAALIRGH